MPILAISLDLDDSLWPVLPALQRAELRLDAWLQRHYPAVASACPIPTMRELRERVAAEHPELAHDFTAQRRLSLHAALAPHGHGAAVIEAAFEEYYAARNEVDLFPDVLPALQRLARRFPLISLSNGNADLQRIGLSGYFQAQVNAREVGSAKPAPDIFQAACGRLRLSPEQVLHVGDDPLLDVLGARSAGLQAVWLNRTDTEWAHPTPPGRVVRDLLELADWLDHQHDGPSLPADRPG